MSTFFLPSENPLLVPPALGMLVVMSDSPSHSDDSNFEKEIDGQDSDRLEQ